MLMNKVSLNKEITDCLGKYIEDTIKTWFRYTVKTPLSYEEFSDWEVPDHEIESAIKCGLPLSEEIETPSTIRVKNILKAKSVTNSFVYSPMSAMYWHTNSNMLGTRIYYTFSLDKAVFKYKDPNTGQIHEDWDNIGWTAREFEITKEKPLWHCVWTSGRRFSFGFVR